MPSWARPLLPQRNTLGAPSGTTDWQQVRRRAEFDAARTRAEVAVALGTELSGRGLVVAWSGNEATARARHGATGRLRWKKDRQVALSICDRVNSIRPVPAGVFRNAASALAALDHRDGRVENAFAWREINRHQLARLGELDVAPLKVPADLVYLGAFTGETTVVLAVRLADAAMVRLRADPHANWQPEAAPLTIRDVAVLAWGEGEKRRVG